MLPRTANCSRGVEKISTRGVVPLDADFGLQSADLVQTDEVDRGVVELKGGRCFDEVKKLLVRIVPKDDPLTFIIKQPGEGVVDLLGFHLLFYHSLRGFTGKNTSDIPLTVQDTHDPNAVFGFLIVDTDILKPGNRPSSQVSETPMLKGLRRSDTGHLQQAINRTLYCFEKSLGGIWSSLLDKILKLPEDIFPCDRADDEFLTHPFFRCGARLRGCFFSRLAASALRSRQNSGATGMDSPEFTPSSNSASSWRPASFVCSSRTRARKYSLTLPNPFRFTWVSTNFRKDSGIEMVTVVIHCPSVVESSLAGYQES
jgi:hypothetical protein